MSIGNGYTEVIRDSNGHEYFVIIGFLTEIGYYLVVNIIYMDDDYKWRYRHF